MPKVFVDPFKAAIVDAAAKKEAAEQSIKSPKEDPIASEIDLKDLSDKIKLVLYREIRSLLQASSTRMLTEQESTALISYSKLVKDLRKDEALDIGNLSDEDLARLAGIK